LRFQDLNILGYLLQCSRIAKVAGLTPVWRNRVVQRRSRTSAYRKAKNPLFGQYLAGLQHCPHVLGDEHYVWCSPVFDLRSRTGLQAAPPPTSCPNDIYHSLRAEVQRRDLHSAKISENRLGILKSVAVKRASRVISDSEAGEITAIVEAAQAADFTPLLYLIPYDPVAHLVREVPVDQRAHPLSEEFVIEALPGELFDVISLERC
jgi:hypothetical protein